VRGRVDLAAEGRPGGDVDHLAAAMRDHMPRRAPGCVHRAEEVGFEHASPGRLPRRIVVRREWLILVDSRVVYENVEAAEALDRLRDHPSYLIGVAHVRTD